MSFDTSGPPDGNPGGAGNDHGEAVEAESNSLERELQALHTAHHNFKAPLLRIRGKRADMRASEDIPKEWKAPIPEEGAWQKIGDDKDHKRAIWDDIEAHYRAGYAVGVVPGRVGLTNIDNDTSPEAERFVRDKLGLPHTRHDSRIRGNGKSHMWYPPLKEPVGGKWYAPGLKEAAGDIRYLGGQVVLWDPCAFVEALMLQTQCIDQTIDIAPLLVDKPKAQASQSSEQSDMPDLAFWQRAIPELRQVGNDPTNWEGPCPGCAKDNGGDGGDDRFHIKIEGERAKWGCRQCYDNLDGDAKRKRTRFILDAARRPAGMGHNKPPPDDDKPRRRDPVDKALANGDIDECLIGMAFLKNVGDTYLVDMRTGEWREWRGGEGWTDKKNALAHARIAGEPLATQHGYSLVPKGCEEPQTYPIRARARWLNTGPLSRALKFAASYRQHSDWDSNPLLLGLPNGRVADLATGEERDVRKDDYITRRVSIMPADSVGTVWPRLIAEWSCGDAGMADFLQLLAGSCLTGISQRRIFVNHGEGANGKSVFNNGLVSVLGNYAANTPGRILVGQGNFHLTFIADFAGARMIYMSEPLEGEHFRASLLKEMSGGELMKANRMRENPFEFRPQATIVLATNTIPDLRDVDKAIKDRLRVIPWEWSGDQDPHLNTELATEEARRQRLRWMMDGAKAFIAAPDFTCDKVKQATAKYIGQQDSVQTWIDACCNLRPEARMGVRDGHRAYANYCLNNGFDCKKLKQWKAAMCRNPAITERVGRGNMVFLFGVETLKGWRE